MNEENQAAFSLQIPIGIPAQEDVDIISNSLEPYLQALISAEYMNNEEVTAYLQFTSYVSSIAPFLLDAFLETYRQLKSQQ